MNGKRNILLVEDEESLAGIIAINLRMEGYTVNTTDNGKMGVDLFEKQDFDLVILDIMLPEMNGLDVCKSIKKLKPNVPVLFISAKGSSMDKIVGLKTGADDYLVKPFDLQELLLRVQVLLKRYPGESKENIFHFRGGVVNFDTFEIHNSKGSQEILSNREILFLKLLTEKSNQVISRDEVLSQLWGADENPSSRTIDNYILSFRKFFEKNSKEPEFFHSIRGIGYKFTP